MAAASKLCHLSLSANKLTSLSTLRSLPHLQVLDVSRNALESLDGIAQLSNLRVLQAHENRIGKRERCTLPLQELDFLEELWLGSNEIEAPSELLCLEHVATLRVLELGPNPITRRVRVGRLPVLCCVLISSTEVVRRQSRHRRGPRAWRTPSPVVRRARSRGTGCARTSGVGSCTTARSSLQ